MRKGLGLAPADDTDLITRGFADARYAPKPEKRLRMMTLCNGGLSGTVVSGQTLSAWSGRIPLKFWETTTRWRWRQRAYNTWGAVAEPAQTGTGLVLGEQALSIDGLGTGDFVGGTTQTLLAGNWTVPTDGSHFDSPWFTDPGQQFQGGVPYLLATGISGSSAARKCGWGQVWQWTNSTTALNPASTGGTIPSGPGGAPIEWFIEYETLTSRGCWLFVGDSIMEGVSGPQGTTQATNVGSPLYQNYPNIWAERSNAMVCNISLAGIAAANFAGAVLDPYTRLDLATPEFDGIVFGLGSNDAGSRTLAQYQPDMRTTIARIKQYTDDPNIPMYAVNIMPRSYGTTPENNRIAYNNFIAQEPWGYRKIIDMNGAFNSATTAMKRDLTSDTIHLSYTGLHRAAAELATVLGRTGYPIT